MREPTIAVGFIIFREGYESELRKNGRFHSEVAEDWVKSSPFFETYKKIQGDKTLLDYHGYESFLINYVGAIKLYDLEDDRLCCYIPRGNNCVGKSFLRRYFSAPVIRFGQKVSYELCGDIGQEYTQLNERPEFISNYNQSFVVDGNGLYHYNPARIGD